MSYLRSNKKIRICIPVIIFVCVALFLTAYLKPDAKAKLNAVTDKTTWIMIGDSYSTRPRSDRSRTWPFLLKKKLGLKTSDVCFIQRSGYGFANRSKKFYTLLKNTDSSHKIKYILIQSGPLNDSKRSKKTIYRWMRKTAKLISIKYPNAKVFYASPNWNCKSKRQRKMLRTRKKWYQKYSKKLGWIYLTKTKNVFVNVKGWSESDGHHPNRNGIRRLVKALYISIRKKL